MQSNQLQSYIQCIKSQFTSPKEIINLTINDKKVTVYKDTGFVSEQPLELEELANIKEFVQEITNCGYSTDEIGRVLKKCHDEMKPDDPDRDLILKNILGFYVETGYDSDKCASIVNMIYWFLDSHNGLSMVRSYTGIYSDESISVLKKLSS